MNRDDVNHLVSGLLLVFVCATGAMGYVQAELELRKFVPHRYLAYATLILVAIHVYLNGGRLLRYLRDRLDKQRPE